MPQSSRHAGQPVPRPPVPEALCKGSTIPDIVRVPARTAFAVDGKAAPGSLEFQAAIQALYAAGYTLKFALKREHRDFRVPPLEGRWWAEPPPKSEQAKPSSWRWQLRMGIPSGAPPERVAEAMRIATAKVPQAPVQQIRIPAQTLGRILHVGPWSDEARSLGAAREAVRKAGLSPAGPHLEVYLSDPRRVEPARLRTVLLLETLSS